MTLSARPSDVETALAAVERSGPGKGPTCIPYEKVAALAGEVARLRARVAELESGGVRHEQGTLWSDDESG